MFKKVLFIFALFLTVAGASALTTVWLSARPVSAYGDVNYRLDVLEGQVRDLDYKINNVERIAQDAETAAVYARCMCR